MSSEICVESDKDVPACADVSTKVFHVVSLVLRKRIGRREEKPPKFVTHILASEDITPTQGTASKRKKSGLCS